MAKRRRKASVKPIFSAFIFGALTVIGVDPGQMLFETAIQQFGMYLQFAALIILAIGVYLSYNSIVEAVKRSRRAYRICGVIGVIAILIAFAAGLLIFSGGEKVMLAFVTSIALWLYAQMR
jgi:hypothetical protein